MKCSGVGTDCLVKHPGTTVTGMKFVGAICDFCEAFVCHSKKCIQEHACAFPFRESPDPGSLSIKCSECQRDVWSHGGRMYQCNICGKWNCQDDQFEHQAMCQTLEGESYKCISCNKRGQWSCMRCKISYCDTHVLSALNVRIDGIASPVEGSERCLSLQALPVRVEGCVQFVVERYSFLRAMSCSEEA